MRIVLSIFLLVSLTSCWPTSVSFMDKGSMPEEWKIFHLQTLDNDAPNTPLSYAMTLSEDIKDGVQNNTRLLLGTSPEMAQVLIEGRIVSFSVDPIALQEGDNAAQNRLTVSVQLEIFITAPEEDKMTMTSTRFVDYPSSQDLSSIEDDLLSEIDKQIVQDVINKLLSNW